MVMHSDLSMSATIAKYFNKLVRCVFIGVKEDGHVPTSCVFDPQAQESARRVFQQGVVENQSGDVVSKRVRPAGAALPRDQGASYQARGIQEEIPPPTPQARTQQPSPSVTVSCYTHTLPHTCTYKPVGACYLAAWQQPAACAHLSLHVGALILSMCALLALSPSSSLAPAVSHSHRATFSCNRRRRTRPEAS